MRQTYTVGDKPPFPLSSFLPQTDLEWGTVKQEDIFGVLIPSSHTGHTEMALESIWPMPPETRSTRKPSARGSAGGAARALQRRKVPIPVLGLLFGNEMFVMSVQ